ncbi:hypothetical protein Tco_0267606 [Tanacetum coccineum]
MSEFNQTSQFAKAVSSIMGIVDQYLASKMKETVNAAVRIQLNKLKEEAEAENQEFLNQVDSTKKAIIKEQINQSTLDDLRSRRDDQDKDEDPSARSDQGTKRRQSSKDTEPLKGSKSKESKSSSPSKGTKSPPTSSVKSTQAEEPEFVAADTKMQQDQGNESGHLDDQPDNEAAPKHDWF